jgi:putative endonuclease
MLRLSHLLRATLRNRRRTVAGMAEDPRRLLGARGEELAARHLEARGLQVVERNFRTRFGELDIVARSPGFLVFCEVKTRIVRDGAVDGLGPLVAIGPRKRRQVRAMAREWLGQGRLEGARPSELRFDAIGIRFDRGGRLLALEHLEAAF